MVNGKKPHFLEVYLPSLSSKRLKIPSNFTKHMKGRTSGLVSLIGPSGNTWHVHLVETNDHLYFDDGWLAFVRDHSIECGDTLVFGYDKNMSFTVQIFDQSSCEKEETFYAKCSEELSDLITISESKRKREGESFIPSVGDVKKMRASCIPTQAGLQIGTDFEEETLCSVDEGHNGSSRNDLGESSEDLKELSERPILLALPTIENGQLLHSLMNNQRKENALKPKKACSKKKKIGTEKKTCISKFIESRAAHYFTSTFPYFVRVMKFSNVSDRSTLKVPIRFSMEHFPDCRFRVTLRNLDGNYWMITAIPTMKKHSTMHTFSAGWLAFVRDNRIKKEDVCIFELVSKLEMRVHILRLSLEGLEIGTQKGSWDSCGVGNDVGSSGLPSPSTNVTLQENGNVHPLKLEYTSEPSICDTDKHDKVSEVVLGPQQEATSSSDASDDYIMPTSTLNIAPLQVSQTQSNRKDHLLPCNSKEAISYVKSEKSEVDIPSRLTTQVPEAIDDAGSFLSFTSPFPNFMKVITTSNVSGSFTLGIPSKFSVEYLPPYKTEIVLRNKRGSSWHVTSGRYGHQTKLSGGWMTFVRENHLKVGDICAFELVDDGVFQVQVFQSLQRVEECPSFAIGDDDPSSSVELT